MIGKYLGKPTPQYWENIGSIFFLNKKKTFFPKCWDFVSKYF